MEWQASLDAMDWPCPVRDMRSNKKCFFTDGLCLVPSVPDIRVAAAAIVIPSGPGTFEVVWSGGLPSSHQTIQRAEVVAGAMATGSWYFVRVARPLMQALDAG